MYRILASCAAAAVTAFVMLPGSAGAIEQRGDSMRTSNLVEVSSARRYRPYRSSYRYPARRYYARSYIVRWYDQSLSYGYSYARGPSWGPAPFPFIFGLPY